MKEWSSVLMLASAAIGLFPLQAKAQEQASPSSPVAFIYVSNSPQNNGSYQVSGFSADSSGVLTPIPGSPFSANVQYMVANGEYLFGDDINPGTESDTIDTFAIGSDGALTEVVSTVPSLERGDGFGSMLLDHTGQSLYQYVYEFQYGNNVLQSYSIDAATGIPSFLGESAPSTEFSSLSFVANNLYVYGANCNGTHNFVPAIYGFKRQSSGKLVRLNIHPSLPKAPAGYFYCPFMTAADNAGNLAIPVDAIGKNSQPWQIATYTADSSGNLTTNSTWSNMPKTAISGFVNAVWMAPSGKLLALGGYGGLEVFHFNGSKPATHYTGLLTSDQISDVYWDNANHLYALSATENTAKLYVFTVTPTSFSQAPGSPYSIPYAFFLHGGLVVLPKS